MMIFNDTNSNNELFFDETYASATRTDDVIRNNLSALMNDFSLFDELSGDLDVDNYRK